MPTKSKDETRSPDVLANVLLKYIYYLYYTICEMKLCLSICVSVCTGAEGSVAVVHRPNGLEEEAEICTAT